jgi:hypothetical protein
VVGLRRLAVPDLDGPLIIKQGKSVAKILFFISFAFFAPGE